MSPRLRPAAPGGRGGGVRLAGGGVCGGVTTTGISRQAGAAVFGGDVSSAAAAAAVWTSRVFSTRDSALWAAMSPRLRPAAPGLDTAGFLVSRGGSFGGDVARL